MPKNGDREQNLGIEARQCPVDGCMKPDEAAEKAVKSVFAILGVDVDEPSEVEEFRKGLRFGEAMHKYADKGMTAFVFVVASAIGGALIYGFVEKIRKIASGE